MSIPDSFRALINRLLWIGLRQRFFCDRISLHPASSSIDWRRLGLLSTRRAEERQRAWEEIGKTRPLKGLEEITSFYSLEEVPELADALLDGKLRGRSLITIAGSEKALVQ